MEGGDDSLADGLVEGGDNSLADGLEEGGDSLADGLVEGGDNSTVKVGRENCLVAIVGGGLTVEGADSLAVLGEDDRVETEVVD